MSAPQFAPPPSVGAGACPVETVGSEWIHLGYPPGWHVDLPSHAEATSARARAWLRARGVLRDAEDERKFERLAVAEYANWPFSRATEERAEVLTRFLALWIFYDDLLEERDDGAEDAVCEAIAGRPDHPPAGSAHLRGWWELGRSYAPVMSAAWRDRLAGSYRAWMRSVREESVAAEEARRTGAAPSVAAHLARRSLNIGMVPTVGFLEYALEQELDPRVHLDPDVHQLCVVAAELVAIVNDTFGYAKDQHHRWPNLVRCVEVERGARRADAFHQVAAMHRSRVMSFDVRAATVRARWGAAVTPWLDALRGCVYGFARWHALAPRYASSYPLEDGRVLRISAGMGAPPGP